MLYFTKAIKLKLVVIPAIFSLVDDVFIRLKGKKKAEVKQITGEEAPANA